MHVGILGGTGPLGRGLALRLAAAGDVGHHRVARSPSAPTRWSASCATAWPEHGPGHRRRRQRRRRPTCEVVVVATPWEAAVATVRQLADRPRGQGRGLGGQRPREAGPRDAGAVIPPRGSVAAAVQAAAARGPGGGGGSPPPGPGAGGPRRAPWAPTCSCAPTTPRPPTADHGAGGVRSTGLRPLDAGSLAQAAAIEAFTAVLVTSTSATRRTARSAVGAGDRPGAARTAVPTP